MAGLTEQRREELGVTTVPKEFERVTKEVFRELTPNRFGSRRDFMLEILSDYSFAYAIKKHFP